MSYAVMEKYFTSDGKNSPNLLAPESVEANRAVLFWQAAKRRRIEAQEQGEPVDELLREERASHAALLRLRVAALETRAEMCRTHLAVTLADLKDYRQRLAALEN